MIGVFGGSGFYELLDEVDEVTLDTPWGAPASPIAVGRVEGREVAFLARHGRRHTFAPGLVPYRANVWAMQAVGATRIYGPCAVGSLQRHIEPGHVVVCDQIVDRTWGRADTYFDGTDVVHVSFADPYCPELRKIAIDTARGTNATVHDEGAVVVIPGPRFSTRAESAMYRSQGFAVINMTQHPEAYLARELGLCYATLAMVTDHDSGVEGIEPVTMAEVMRVFDRNLGVLREILLAAVAATPEDRGCTCANAAGGKVPTPPT